ncbi:MAG TPA: transposase [Xanthobacteraceae bacterium]|nr:transposase [Xanthobacteraceae bacterium]
MMAIIPDLPIKALIALIRVVLSITAQDSTSSVYTNTIEGFWSIFNRGIVGSFHKVSRKYMPLYVAEFSIQI